MTGTKAPIAQLLSRGTGETLVDQIARTVAVGSPFSPSQLFGGYLAPTRMRRNVATMQEPHIWQLPEREMARSSP